MGRPCSRHAGCRRLQSSAHVDDCVDLADVAGRTGCRGPRPWTRRGQAGDATKARCVGMIWPSRRSRRACRAAGRAPRPARHWARCAEWIIAACAACVSVERLKRVDLPSWAGDDAHLEAHGAFRFRREICAPTKRGGARKASRALAIVEADAEPLAFVPRRAHLIGEASFPTAGSAPGRGSIETVAAQVLIGVGFPKPAPPHHRQARILESRSRPIPKERQHRGCPRGSHGGE